MANHEEFIQTGLINLEKQKIDLEELRQRSQLSILSEKASLEAEIAKLSLDKQERQNTIDFAKTKNDFWWVTLPRTVGFVALGIIMLV